jgi:Hydantoinase B/oxoprolinase
MRARRDQKGDFNALIGACQVGERNLIAMIDKYGEGVVDTCIGELLDMADRHMRALIRTASDGTYKGVAVLEDAGHGFGDFEVKATVTIKDDSCHIVISRPPQIPYFTNSYEGNSHSGVYLGLMMFAALPPLDANLAGQCGDVGGGRAAGPDEHEVARVESLDRLAEARLGALTRSRMASASVGTPIKSCQRSMGT